MIDETTGSDIQICGVFLGCLNVFEERLIKCLKKIDRLLNDDTSFYLIGEHGCAFDGAVKSCLS